MGESSNLAPGLKALVFNCHKDINETQSPVIDRHSAPLYTIEPIWAERVILLLKHCCKGLTL